MVISMTADMKQRKSLLTLCCRFARRHFLPRTLPSRRPRIFYQCRSFIRTGAAQQQLFHRGVYGSKWRVLVPVSKWNAVCARIFQEALSHLQLTALELP